MSLTSLATWFADPFRDQTGGPRRPLDGLSVGLPKNGAKEEGPGAPSVTCKKIETNMAVDHVERKTDA